MKKINGEIKYQIGEKVIRRNMAHCRILWPFSDWDEALKRELELDAKRPIKPKG